MNEHRIFTHDGWVTVEPPKVNKDKLRRPSKHTDASLYRDHPHTTIQGIGGLIAKIVGKK